MRLINTQTLELEEFIDSRHAPPYAILSHAWEAEEVSFQDFRTMETATSKKGFAKIQRICIQARKKGLDYAWVDTCCIDKTSSAELTEAINSMFQWYAGSRICYVWLSDLAPDQKIEDLSRCRWWTRGWTLQELLAPKDVEFYDRDWTLRGTKSELRNEIHGFTGIDKIVLRSGPVGVILELLLKIPVARRMSWAANRVTDRKSVV